MYGRTPTDCMLCRPGLWKLMEHGRIGRYLYYLSSFCVWRREGPPSESFVPSSHLSTMTIPIASRVLFLEITGKLFNMSAAPARWPGVPGFTSRVSGFSRSGVLYPPAGERCGPAGGGRNLINRINSNNSPMTTGTAGTAGTRTGTGTSGTSLSRLLLVLVRVLFAERARPGGGPAAGRCRQILFGYGRCGRQQAVSKPSPPGAG